MTPTEKAESVYEVFGGNALKVIEEILDNNEECASRYKSNYDRVCIKQYWVDVQHKVEELMHNDAINNKNNLS